jgi:hypothetical protein
MQERNIKYSVDKLNKEIEKIKELRSYMYVTNSTIPPERMYVLRDMLANIEIQIRLLSEEVNETETTKKLIAFFNQ